MHPPGPTNLVGNSGGITNPTAAAFAPLPQIGLVALTKQHQYGRYFCGPWRGRIMFRWAKRVDATSDRSIPGTAEKLMITELLFIGRFTHMLSNGLALIHTLAVEDSIYNP